MISEGLWCSVQNFLTANIRVLFEVLNEHLSQNVGSTIELLLVVPSVPWLKYRIRDSLASSRYGESEPCVLDKHYVIEIPVQCRI